MAATWSTEGGGGRRDRVVVTNELRHGLGTVVARSSVVDGEIRVSVTDSGESAPVVQAPGPQAIGGVGLHIVERLSDRWGVAAFPGGKTVWAGGRADAR